MTKKKHPKAKDEVPFPEVQVKLAPDLVVKFLFSFPAHTAVAHTSPRAHSVGTFGLRWVNCVSEPESHLPCFHGASRCPTLGTGLPMELRITGQGQSSLSSLSLTH